MTDLTCERVAVLGDIGGHPLALARVLGNLGVRLDREQGQVPVGLEWAQVPVQWPAGLVVVSVGDLVHRGPDSMGVLALVDQLIRAGHWRQVVGNHEQLYVDRPVFGWREKLEEPGVDLLRAWWAEGSMVPAVAIETGDGDHLVTHAGLTCGFWLALGSPGSAALAAEMLAETGRSGELWRPGSMLGYRCDWSAGPVWAEAGSELLASWHVGEEAGAQLAFHQVHGHTSCYDWDARRWRCPDQVRSRVTLHRGRRHAVAQFTTATITGIDPGHGARQAPVFEPLVLTGARVAGSASTPAH